MLHRDEHIIIVQNHDRHFHAEVRRAGLDSYHVIARGSGENLIEAVTDLNVNLSFARSSAQYLTRDGQDR